jgi:hypothetical protein
LCACAAFGFPITSRRIFAQLSWLARRKAPEIATSWFDDAGLARFVKDVRSLVPKAALPATWYIHGDLDARAAAAIERACEAGASKNRIREMMIDHLGIRDLPTRHPAAYAFATTGELPDAELLRDLLQEG